MSGSDSDIVEVITKPKDTAPPSRPPQIEPIDRFAASVTSKATASKAAAATAPSTTAAPVLGRPRLPALTATATTPAVSDAVSRLRAFLRQNFDTEDVTALPPEVRAALLPIAPAEPRPKLSLPPPATAKAAAPAAPAVSRAERIARPLSTAAAEAAAEIAERKAEIEERERAKRTAVAAAAAASAAAAAADAASAASRPRAAPAVATAIATTMFNELEAELQMVQEGFAEIPLTTAENGHLFVGLLKKRNSPDSVVFFCQLTVVDEQITPNIEGEPDFIKSTVRFLTAADAEDATKTVLKSGPDVGIYLIPRVVYPDREIVVKGSHLTRRDIVTALSDLDHPVELMPMVMINRDLNLAVLRFEEAGDVPSIKDYIPGLVPSEGRLLVFLTPKWLVFVRFASPFPTWNLTTEYLNRIMRPLLVKLGLLGKVVLYAPTNKNGRFKQLALIHADSQATLDLITAKLDGQIRLRDTRNPADTETHPVRIYAPGQAPDDAFLPYLERSRPQQRP